MIFTHYITLVIIWVRFLMNYVGKCLLLRSTTTTTTNITIGGSVRKQQLQQRRKLMVAASAIGKQFRSSSSSSTGAVKRKRKYRLMRSSQMFAGAAASSSSLSPPTSAPYLSSSLTSPSLSIFTNQIRCLSLYDTIVMNLTKLWSSTESSKATAEKAAPTTTTTATTTSSSNTTTTGTKTTTTSTMTYPINHLNAAAAVAAAQQYYYNSYVAQKFEYFLILDFEATCDSPHQLHPMEIIEFPVLKLNGKTFEVESTFHRYVRPTVNPLLSPFCVQLTGILQEMVDRSDKFNKTFYQFEQWLIQEGLVDGVSKWPLKSFTFITCGDWDLKRILPLQCRLCGIPMPSYMRRWINVKKSFADQLHHWPRSQQAMLEHFRIQPVGRAHSGIDDCYNLASIVREIAKLGYVYQNTSSYVEP